MPGHNKMKLNTSGVTIAVCGSLLIVWLILMGGLVTAALKCMFGTLCG